MNVNEAQHERRLEDLRLILRDFLKVTKVVTMYPEDNPLPQSLKRAFAGRLADLVEDYGRLDFAIDKGAIRIGKEIVFTDKSRDESLAGLFFEAGINKLMFEPGLDVDTIYDLLDAIKAHQNSDRRASDLAALIWEAGLANISIETVEDAALREYEGDFLTSEDDLRSSVTVYVSPYDDPPEEYSAIFDSEDSEADPSERDAEFESGYLDDESGGIERARLQSVLSSGDEQRDEQLQVNAAAEAMGLDDAPADSTRLPDTNLILSDEHKLSDEEVEQVQSLIRQDADFAEYESVCALLKEILHQESELSAFSESVTICDRIMTELVAVGKLTFAADLMRYFGYLEDQLRNDKPRWAERLKEARVTAGSRQRLGVLCQTLNQYEQIGSHELRRYLDNFEWEALIGITDMLGDLIHEVHRRAVSGYLTERGQDRIPILARGLYEKKTESVLASVSILARVGSNAALAHLRKIVEHPEPAVRRQLATDLAECSNEQSIELLRELALDADPRTRREAVAALLARRGEPAFEALSEIVASNRFSRLDPEDRRSILIAYSTLGADYAVDTLKALATRFNPFRSGEVTQYRKAAFDALAHNRGDKAEQLLLHLTGSWRPDIRARARDALHKRRERIYGE